MDLFRFAVFKEHCGYNVKGIVEENKTECKKSGWHHKAC
jgi:hypothetical protein